MGYAISIPFVVLLAIFAYRAPSPSASGIIDPDYYWHLSYGDWIIQNGRLPTEDFWSWTFDGHAYRLTQWLGEVAMAFANQMGGTLGTSTLSALLLTLTLAASYKAARCFLDNRLAALAVSIGCNAILVSLACRPHQFTHLGLAILTWMVASFQTTGKHRPLYFVPVLMAIWVNLHGGYAVGLAYLWMMTGLVVVDAFVSKRPDEIRTVAIPLAIAAAIGTLSTLLNPYGWEAWVYAFEIASLKSSAAGIVDEWAATSIKTEVGLNFFLITSAMFVAMAAARQRPRIAQLLAAVALCAIGWSAVRISLMSTILIVPILASALRSTSFYDLAFNGDGRRYDRLIPLPVAVGVLAALATLTVWLGQIDQTAARHVTANMPEQEVRFMQAHHIEGRILNAPEAGGYLIRKLGQKVSLDTRLDLYGDRALFEYLFARRGEVGWREYIERMNPDVVLINNQAALRQLLSGDGKYRLVFEGAAYSILLKASMRLDIPTVFTDLHNNPFLSQLKS